MNKQKVKEMRVEINKALEVVRKLHPDMNLQVGSIRFTDTGFKAQVICEEQTADGVNAKYIKDWEEAVRLDLVKAEHLGVITEDRGQRYKVIGYDFAKIRNCIVLEQMSSGKIYITGKLHFLNKAFTQVSNITLGKV